MIILMKIKQNLIQNGDIFQIIYIDIIIINRGSGSGKTKYQYLSNKQKIPNTRELQ